MLRIIYILFSSHNRLLACVTLFIFLLCKCACVLIEKEMFSFKLICQQWLLNKKTIGLLGAVSWIALITGSNPCSKETRCKETPVYYGSLQFTQHIRECFRCAHELLIEFPRKILGKALRLDLLSTTYSFNVYSPQCYKYSHVAYVDYFFWLFAIIWIILLTHYLLSVFNNSIVFNQFF